MGVEIRKRLKLNATTIFDDYCVTNRTSFKQARRSSARYDFVTNFIKTFCKWLNYSYYLFLFTFGLLVLRKTYNAVTAVTFVTLHQNEVSQASIQNSKEFSDLLYSLKTNFDRPPAIFFLNQYALNMTFNFLCSTKDMHGVHDRFIFITLDDVARDVFREYWPNVQQIFWPTPCLYEPFSFAEGAYQILYLFRSNLAASLIKNGKSFWMMQQDTFWRENLFDLKLEDNKDFDALFDQLGGANSVRSEWVNGANFFVHANNDTLKFFEAVSRKLSSWYTPDMGVMIYQCHMWEKPNCQYIPFSIAHSWEWMYTDQNDPPYIIQLDCETDGGSKLMQLAKYGFYFMSSNDSRACNATAVGETRNRMKNGNIDVKSPRISWGRLQFKAYWWIVDGMLSTPIIGPIIKPYMPALGFILMITI